MIDPDINQRVETVFRNVFGNKACNFHEDLCPDGVRDWDSMAQIQLILALEKEFDISISTKEIVELNSAGVILIQISDKLLKKGEADARKNIRYSD